MSAGGHGADRRLELYTSEGDVIRDGREMQELAQDWHEWEMGDEARRNGATSLSMILSMPSGTDPERVKEAALDFAREEFANRSWVASLHVDRDHPHVHVTFAHRDHDGRRFHPDRDDLFRYRQRFAQKLRERGIEANAIPAKARGIDPKHEHIAAKKVRAKGGVPRIDKSRIEREQCLRQSERSDPVRVLLGRRQASVRGTYERSIAELRSSPSIVNQTVANSLQRFIDGLPVPEPNSLRATRAIGMDRDSAASPMTRVTIEKGAEVDPVAAAVTRAKAVQDRIDARRAEERSAPLAARQRPQPAPPDRGLAGAEQSRSEGVGPPSPRKPDGLDDIVR